jgi:hypothetical protein
VHPEIEMPEKAKTANNIKILPDLTTSFFIFPADILTIMLKKKLYSAEKLAKHNLPTRCPFTHSMKTICICYTEKADNLL